MWGEASVSDWKDFKIGFRHPFGPHAGELRDGILPRKKDEVKRNGWTLWSFRSKNLENWHRELIAANPPSVFVFRLGKNASDPSGSRGECAKFRYVDESDWEDIPQAIKVPHPFKPGEREASAFVVERVEYPIPSFSPPAVMWFYERKRSWEDGIEGRPGVMLPYPTKGEYLIRPGGTHRMQKEIHAILKLKPPYLAYVGI
jgi:hypothetical protein